MACVPVLTLHLSWNKEMRRSIMYSTKRVHCTVWIELALILIHELRFKPKLSLYSIAVVGFCRIQIFCMRRVCVCVLTAYLK